MMGKTVSSEENAKLTKWLKTKRHEKGYTMRSLAQILGNLGRTLLSSYSGVVIDDWLMGNWSLFFVLTALMVLP